MRAPRGNLERWDTLLRERHVTGIYGADAHGQVAVTEKIWLPGPSYEHLFAVARNHLLLRRPLSRAGVLEALRDGRLYVGVDAIAPSDGFSFAIVSPDGRQWTMGESARFEAGLHARAGGRVPAGTELRLVRNGEVIATAIESLDSALPGAGIYRVEAYVPGWSVPWVLTNPVIVAAPGDASERRAPWPSPSAAVPPAAMLDAFEGATVFSAGRDDASELSEPILAPAEGVRGGGAARLAFRLAGPTPDHPDVFVALVNREPRDLSGRRGLTFWVRGDGVYRLWVQVRDENPASTDEGTEWWFASVKTATEWRQVSVPFERLRSTQAFTDGRLDLDAVRAVVLVIDKGAVKPGVSGTIWIDELGVY